MREPVGAIKQARHEAQSYIHNRRGVGRSPLVGKRVGENFFNLELGKEFHDKSHSTKRRNGLLGKLDLHLAGADLRARILLHRLVPPFVSACFGQHTDFK